MLKIINLTTKNIFIAKSILPNFYLEKLKNKTDESILARYEIYKNYNFLVENNSDNIPIPTKNTF